MENIVKNKLQIEIDHEDQKTSQFQLRIAINLKENLIGNQDLII